MAETGHAKNIANFGTMISFVSGYGSAYDPSNTTIELAALQAKLAAASGSLDGVGTALAPWKTKVNDRETAFLGLRKLVTRVVNSFAASGANQNAIDDAKAIKRKIDGARAKALPQDDPETPENESQGNSVSQRSYTQTVEHFDALIEFLTNNASFYAPNENDLKLTTLTAKATAMKSANAAVLTTATPLSNARITRDVDLYNETSGLVDVAALVKKYVKSLFGADSPQYKQISGLEFRKVKKINVAPPPPNED